jgi:N-acetylglutamate synthase/N-acetylornithine aminotransferase
MYGNEDRNGATRNKVRNCDFKKDYVSGNAHVTTEELQG